MVQRFENWLESVYIINGSSRLKLSSVSNYVYAIKKVNEYIQQEGIAEGKSLFDLDVSTEAIQACKTISTSPNFIEKNTTANNKYSSASSRYTEFIEYELNNHDKAYLARIPLNQILFGPPGTGKTYGAIDKALEIILPKEELQKLNSNPEIEKGRKAKKEHFDRLIDEEQIKFVTFHQSMSYEDFVEGIKPSTQNGEISYSDEPGIFKKICKLATDSAVHISHTVTIDGKDQELKKEMFAQYYQEFAKSLPSSQTEEGTELLTKKGSAFYLFKNTANGITVKAGEQKTDMSLSMAQLTRVLFGEGIPYYGSYEPVAIEEILKGKNYKKHDEPKKTDAKNYVLIIDEINRGNVSAIFGELITLIEKDKRIGNKEQLRVQLPYSKSMFGVPKNLYIIGTMNTADRSVEALDSALRRRFSFEEVSPNIEVIRESLENDGIVDQIDIPYLLTVINQRIEVLLDKDHEIGHSYFLNVKSWKELKKVFQANIIPLLQEYFFGDIGKIGLVIGRGFIEEQQQSVDFADFEYENSGMLSERKIFKSRNLTNISKSDFLKAIESISPGIFQNEPSV
jgi:5-methylcytosine-specific restriction protein B